MDSSPRHPTDQQTHHVVHDLLGPVCAEIVINIHIEIILIALLLLFHPLHQQLKPSLRHDPLVLRVLVRGFHAHALFTTAAGER